MTSPRNVERGAPVIVRRPFLSSGLVAIGILAILCVAFGLAVARGEEPGGIDDLWATLFGPPDLGAVDVATVARSALPVDALACPPNRCRAPADLITPVYPVSGERLRALAAAAAAADPGVELVFQARWEEVDRYVSRSGLLRRPDTITVAIEGAGEGRSTLALYSRSQVALTDFGGNRARLERWLARIADATRDEQADPARP